MAIIENRVINPANRRRERESAALAAKTASEPASIATAKPPAPSGSEQSPAPASAEPALPSAPSDVSAASAVAAPVPPTPVEVLPIPPDDAGRLTPAQRSAIALLAQGRSIKSTAGRIGVHRMTIHRWLRDNPDFRAAFHAWEDEALQSARAQLVGLTGLAVKAYGAALRQGDARAAGQLLKGMGVMAPPPGGPQDPDECRRVAKLERRERESALIEDETAAAWRLSKARDNRPWSVQAAEKEKAEAAEKARQLGQADSPKMPE